MDALRIIQDEHQSLAAILHAVRYMLKEIGGGRLEPDFKLLAAMVRYLDDYPEKRHHPKEDHYLFARLKQKTTEGAEALDRLEREHAAGDARIKALAEALHRFEAGDPGGYDGFVQAFERFADFYRNHMMLEEREVLPLCRKHFSAADWDWVAEGFRSHQDPMAGTRAGEDFGRIFSRLVASAPAPIGLGAGPYRDD